MTVSIVDDEVVLGDHRLRRERDDLLAQVDERPHAVDERDHDREAGVERAAVAAEPLDDGRRAPAGRSAPSSRARAARRARRRPGRSAPRALLILLFDDERGRALDLRDLDARTRLDHLVRRRTRAPSRPRRRSSPGRRGRPPARARAACAPASAAVPVRSAAGVRRCRRATAAADRATRARRR